MEMFVTSNQPAPSQREVCTKHKSRELLWRIPARIPQAEFDIFREINAYWATLPMSEQDRIFAVYERIHSYFAEIFDTDRLFDALRPRVQELFALHPQDRIDYWVRFKSNLLVPSTLPRQFDPNLGSRMTPEKTYTEEDYRLLLDLAVTVRIMVPIWGEFLKRTEKETDPLRKEYMAYKLAVTSNIRQCEALQRLEVYVRHTVTVDKSLRTSTVLGALGTEDYHEWVLAHILVLRLCRYDLSGVGDNAVIITHVHNYIREHIGIIESRYGRVRDKKSGESEAMQTNHSRLEGFRIRETVSAGDVMMIDAYLRMAQEQVFGRMPMPPLALVNRLAQKPEQSQPDSGEQFRVLCEQSLKSIELLSRAHLKSSQVAIAGWVMADLVSPRSIPYLKKSTLLILMGFAQAWLWYNGYRDLAALVSARAVEDAHGDQRILGDSREKLSRAQLAAITTAFPFMRPTSSYSRNARNSSMAFEAMEEVSRDLGDYDWQITLPEAWLLTWTERSVYGALVDRRLRIPGDLLPQLSGLVMELEVRRKTTAEISPATMFDGTGVPHSLLSSKHSIETPAAP